MKKMVLIPYEQFQSSENLNNDDATKDDLIKSSPNKLDRELVLIPFGKNSIKQASSLLSYVERNMSWNENGEIIIQNEIVPGSHITDLLKDALYMYKDFNPVGYVLFYQNLSSIPISLVRNRTRKHLVGRGSQARDIPPPPGLPIQHPAVELNTTIANSWKSAWKTV